MITELYTVYDAAVKAFLPPFHVRSRGEALRSFTEAVNSADHQFHKWAADYTLFFIGTFDDATAEYKQPSTGQKVITAIELRVDDGVLPPDRRGPG